MAGSHIKHIVQCLYILPTLKHLNTPIANPLMQMLCIYKNARLRIFQLFRLHISPGAPAAIVTYTAQKQQQNRQIWE